MRVIDIRSSAKRPDGARYDAVESVEESVDGVRDELRVVVDHIEHARHHALYVMETNLKMCLGSDVVDL